MTNAQREAEGADEPHVAIQRISHELRTPLTVVIGFCELLTGERPDDDSIKEFAARICANAWQLHSAVERLVMELQIANYTGPPNDLAFPWLIDPGSTDLKPPLAETDRPTGARNNQPPNLAPADDPSPVP
jgi:signal transduction histidine kinase